MSEKKVHPPKATPKQVKKMEKKVEKKVEKQVVKAVEQKVERKVQKQASNQIKEKIQKIILGKLNSVDYEGVSNKLGTKGKEMVERSCEHLTDAAKRYALAQAMPSMYQSKIPDAFNRSTAFYHSKRVFEVKVGFKDVNDVVNYDFAFLVQPKLGNFGDPRGFQVALVRQDALLNPQNYDFEDVGTYETLGQSDGTNIKVDTNFTPLTAKPAGSFIGTGSSTGKTGATPFGDTLLITPSNYNLNPVYRKLTNSRFYLPMGDYMVNVLAIGTGFTVVGGGVIAINSPATVSVVGAEVLTGTSPTGTQDMKNFMISVTNDQANYFDLSLAATTITASQIIITPAQFNNSNAPIDDGLVETIRPTAMSVLTSYKGPLLTNGGQIAGALLPSAALDTNFFTNNPVEPGAFRSWQTIATLVEDVKDNALCKGNHTTWRQEDPIDYDLFPPSKQNDYPYPAIVVAGTWNPGSAPTDEVAIVRVEIDIQFEYRTTKSLVQKEKYVGSQDDMDIANHLLQKIDVSMENEEHVPKFKQFFGDVVKAAEVGTQIAAMFA